MTDDEPNELRLMGRIADALERIAAAMEGSKKTAPGEAAEDHITATLLGRELDGFFSVRTRKVVRKAWNEKYPISPIDRATLRHALEFTAAELIKVRGSGVTVIAELRQKLATVGLKLRGD